jgi:hypothetical protein
MLLAALLIADVSLAAPVIGQGWISSLASDGRTLFYVVDRGDGVDELRARPTSGGPARRLTDEVWGLPLVLDDEFVYFVDLDDRLRRVDKRGGPAVIVAEQLGRGPSWNAYPIGIDAAAIYVHANQRITRIDKRSGAKSAFAELEWDAHTAIVDGGAVYYTRNGELRRRRGADDTRVAALAWADLAADARFVYALDFCTNHNPREESVVCLWRVDKRGGEAELLQRIRTHVPVNARWLAVDDTTLWVAITELGVGRILRFEKR